MRMYGKKFVRRSVNKRLNVRTESRDAVLWAIDWENRICNVKIQGSNELVTAHFPQNEAVKMPYMREGNAVRVVHRGGVRGYLEVVGHGMAIPTPVAGDSHPAISDLPNGMTEGGQIIPTEPPSLCVTILDGYYRINGVLYSLSGGASGYEAMSETSDVTMNETYPPMVMGDTGDYPTMEETSDITMNEVFPPMTMGEPIDDYCLDAMPSGNKFRYDAFYVGTDGIITYLKGTEASSDPAKPAIPDDHVQIGQYILVWTGMTEITGRHIGMEWAEPYASDVAFDCIDEFPWNDSNPTPETNVKVTVLSQYAWALSGTYTIYLTMPMGTKQIYSAQSGWSESEVSQQIEGSYYTFKYQREEWTVFGGLILMSIETSPFFVAVAYDSSGRATTAGHHRIILLTEGGSEIEGVETNKIVLPTTIQYIESDEGAAAIDWGDGYQVAIEAEEDVTFTFDFTAPNDKAKLILLIEQDSTGGWTPTLPLSDINIAEEVGDADVDETANSRTYLGFIYHAGTSKYDLVAKATIIP